MSYVAARLNEVEHGLTYIERAVPIQQRRRVELARMQAAHLRRRLARVVERATTLPPPPPPTWFIVAFGMVFGLVTFGAFVFWTWYR